MLKNIMKFLRNPDFTWLVILLIVILVILIFILLIRLAKVNSSVRKDAIKRSKAVIGGQVFEQIAPYLPDFPCNPADAKFLGKPVDFVAFPGLSDSDKVDEILLIEVKTGQSALSSREKEIKKAVKEGRVRYVEYRLK